MKSFTECLNERFSNLTQPRLRMAGFLFIGCVFVLAGELASQITAWRMPTALQLLHEAYFITPPWSYALLFAALCVCLWGGWIMVRRSTLRQGVYCILLSLALALSTCLPYYAPVAIIQWYIKLGHLTITSGYWGFAAFMLCLSVGVTFLVGLFVNFYKPAAAASTIHGSARWANRQDIEKSKLLNPSNGNYAVYVGAWEDPKTKKIHYLRSSEPEHVFAYAPTRSGKGVGLVVPTLLSYRGSKVTSDFKMENWQLTAGWRQSIGQVVLKLQPTCTDGSAARFNPLFEIRQGVNEVRDTQNLVQILLDPDGTARKDHWTSTANTLLVGTVLHVLYAEANKTLNGVLTFLTHPARSKEQILNLMLQTKHDPQSEFGWISIATGQPTQVHQVVASTAREMLNKSENELSGVFSTATTVLKLYLDPVIAQNTADSDFCIRDLVFHEKPVSLYLGIPPSDIERIMPYMRIVLQQILARLTEEMDFTTGKNGAADRHPLLFMLDEFPQFGRMTFFENALAYVAGYGIRFYLIAQDLLQLYARYGRMQTVTSNTSLRTAYAPNTPETANYISEILGNTTVVQEHVSYSGRREDFTLKNKTQSEHEVRRPLLTPDELSCLGDERAITMRANSRPIYGLKIINYQDAVFNARSKILAPAQSDRLLVAHPWHNIIKSPEHIEILQPCMSSLSTVANKSIKANVSTKATKLSALDILNKLAGDNKRMKNQTDDYLSDEPLL